MIRGGSGAAEMLSSAARRQKDSNLARGRELDHCSSFDGLSRILLNSFKSSVPSSSISVSLNSNDKLSACDARSRSLSASLKRRSEILLFVASSYFLKIATLSWSSKNFPTFSVTERMGREIRTNQLQNKANLPLSCSWPSIGFASAPQAAGH